jgi:hypothetical protein
MLPYTATDLVEIMRRETGVTVTDPRTASTRTAGFVRLLRRRAAARVTARR